MSVKTVSSQADAANPLGYEKEGKLLVGFAIPCIISMLVTALYNIVDQIFIGQGVGLLGNAATNIAFPLSIACTAIALLLGIGSATNFMFGRFGDRAVSGGDGAADGGGLRADCGVHVRVYDRRQSGGQIHRD